MKEISNEYVACATNGILYAEDRTGRDAYIKDVSIDSGRITENSLFFCIIGAKNDAHKFLPEVRIKGCRNVVVSDKTCADKMKALGDMNVILVDDTTKALMLLAGKYFSEFRGTKKIGITGSVGKTSTKEYVYNVISSKYKTGKTKGNLNSEYGVPLTIFDFDENIEAAVLEMGTGGSTKLAELSKIVRPENAVITTIGTSHLETFGSREKLLEEKLHIADGFTDRNSLVVNNDCDLLKPEIIKEHIKSKPNIITIGTSNENNYILKDVCDKGIDGVECILEINCNASKDNGNSYQMKLLSPGKHNLFNAAEAVALGQVYGIRAHDAVAALSGADMCSNRLDVVSCSGYKIVNDTYNASPESMKSGIDVLINSHAERKIAILGDMYELGYDSDKFHAEVGRYAANSGVDVLIAVGGYSEVIAEAAASADKRIKTYSCKTREEAEQIAESIIRRGDLIFVKASRSMEFDRLVDAIS